MIQSINVEEAYKLLRLNLKTHLIDVREIFEIGSDIELFMDNCHNIAWNSNSVETFIENIDELIANKEEMIIFLCARGIRSHKAAILIESFGYNNCFDISSGITIDFYQKLVCQTL